MSDTIFQFKLSLKEIQPPIWRRFQVRSDITFRDLHNTLQVVVAQSESCYLLICKLLTSI